MHRLPPLIQLRAFEAAARHMSFKEAAEELHVSPTAISHQIRLLEEYLECKLFQRQPRPITLTREGKTLFPVLETGFTSFTDAILSVRQISQSVQIKLTTTSSFATMWLVPRLSDWRNLHPNLELEIIATDSLLNLDADADFSVRYMFEPPPPSDDLVVEELVRDRLIVVCSPKLLENRRPLKNLADLKGQTLVHTHWSDSDIHAPIWPRWFEKASCHYGESVELNEFKHLTFHEEMHAIDAVLNASGFMVVSDVLVAGEIESNNLVRALDFVYPGYGFFITYSKTHPHVDTLASFANWASREANPQL